MSSSRLADRSAVAVDRASLASKDSTISLGREVGKAPADRTLLVIYSKSSRKCLVVQEANVAQPGDRSSRLKAKT